MKIFNFFTFSFKILYDFPFLVFVYDLVRFVFISIVQLHKRSIEKKFVFRTRKKLCILTLVCLDM